MNLGLLPELWIKPVKPVLMAVQLDLIIGIQVMHVTCVPNDTVS